MHCSKLCSVLGSGLHLKLGSASLPSVLSLCAARVLTLAMGGPFILEGVCVCVSMCVCVCVCVFACACACMWVLKLDFLIMCEYVIS